MLLIFKKYNYHLTVGYIWAPSKWQYSYEMTDIALSQRSSSILKHGFFPTHANTRNSRKLKTHFWQFDNMCCEHLQRNMVQVAQVTVDVHVFRTTIKCDKHTYVTEVGFSSAMLENEVKLTNIMAWCVFLWYYFNCQVVNRYHLIPDLSRRTWPESPSLLWVSWEEIIYVVICACWRAYLHLTVLRLLSACVVDRF